MAKKQLSFEKAIDRLEEIVQMLESGEYELDKSLSLFEEGVNLVKFCNSKLESVETTIKILLNDNGELKEGSFKPDEE